MAVISSVSTRSIRNVALPIEHGGWAFLVEPMLLGLLLAPSLAGFFLCAAGLGIFLLYQPTHIAFKDWLKRKSYPRTVWAIRFVVLYGMLVVGGMLLALLAARSPFWTALLLAMPFAGLQMILVVRGQARAAVTEISGAVALAALTPAILMAGGKASSYAFALWLVPALRAFTSILYIRARLRRSRGEAVKTATPLVAQSISILILGVAWLASRLPITALLAILILTARAIYGLYWASSDTPTKHIGFQEIGFGLLTVILAAVG